MNRPTIKGSFMIPSSRFLFLQLKINPSYILMDLHINNSKILDFFRNHSNIDPQTFIASSIDFYEFVLSSISQNNTSQILPYILSQNNLLNNLVIAQIPLSKLPWKRFIVRVWAIKKWQEMYYRHFFITYLIWKFLLQ